MLSLRVVSERVRAAKYIGDSTGEVRSSGQDPLQLAGRAHANFCENVPLAIVLAAAAELNGANKRYLNYTLAALLVARILHVEVGLRAKDDGAALGRPIGYFATTGIAAGLAGWSAYLVKGYWGF